MWKKENLGWLVGSKNPGMTGVRVGDLKPRWPTRWINLMLKIITTVFTLSTKYRMSMEYHKKWPFYFKYYGIPVAKKKKNIFQRYQLKITLSDLFYLYFLLNRLMFSDHRLVLLHYIYITKMYSIMQDCICM